MKPLCRIEFDRQCFCQVTSWSLVRFQTVLNGPGLLETNSHSQPFAYTVATHDPVELLLL